MDSLDHRIVFLDGLGPSPDFVHYIRLVYRCTYLKIGGGWVNQGCGVFKVNPLSPVLFNIALDYILKKLSLDVGYRHGNEIIPVLSFAGDLILFHLRGVLISRGATQIGFT